MPDDRFQAGSTFDASSDHYEDPAISFAATAGAQLAALVGLQPGERVLDCACGTGHSAIPAAARVGPAGKVIGIDLATRLLELGRDKAARAGLHNIELRQGDMERLAFPPASFDAVLCGFGLFFAADMEALIRTLWRLLRPGGRLGLTTWGGDAFEPAHSGAFVPSLAAEAPALAELPEPWRRADTPSDMSALLRGADIPAEVIEVRSSFLLRSPEDWWTIVIGIGTRWYIEQMDPATRERVRIANLRWIEQHRLRAIAMDVVYSIASKPSQGRP